MRSNDDIKRTLEYISSKKEQYEKAVELQSALWHGEKTELPPLALVCDITEEQEKWINSYNMSESHFNKEKMLKNNLRSVITVANGAYGAVPSVRANMGCGVVPSLFGNNQRLFDDKMPWMTDHVSKDDLSQITKFEPSPHAEFYYALEHMEYMLEQLKETGVYIFPVDLQGAVDTAHLIYGDQFFYDVYDDPEFVHHLLDLSCDAMFYAMDKCLERMDNSDKYVAHYNYLIIPRDMGGVKLSEDTTTLLSPGLIEDYAKPYLQRTLDRFGGGYVHYCGKNDYLLEMVINEPQVKGINFGNPEKHNIQEILALCCDKGKLYVGDIPPNNGEKLFDYFYRLLKASYKNGRFHLILRYSCSLDQRESVINTFEKAADTVIKTS